MNDLKAKSIAWHEAFGTNRITRAYDECLADDFKALFFGHGWVDKSAYTRGDQEFAKAFENMTMRVEEAIQENDTVFCRMRWTGRQVGEVLGIAATGKTFEVIGFCRDKYRDGKVVEHVPLFDIDSLKTQLTGGGKSGVA